MNVFDLKSFVISIKSKVRSFKLNFTFLDFIFFDMQFDRTEVVLLNFLDLARCSLLFLVCWIFFCQFDLLMLGAPLHSLLSIQLKSLEKLRPF